MQAAQISSGVPLGDFSALLDYTTATYLTKPAPVLTNCGAAAGSAAAGALNLEADATAACGEFPLANITQGSSNSCSAFAFAQAFTVRAALQTRAPPPQLSPLFAYYFQRVQQCSADATCACPTCKSGSSSTCTACEPPCLDCGSYLGSALDVFSAGVCASSAWPLSQPLNATPSPAARVAATYTISRATCIAVDTATIVAALQTGAPVVVLFRMSPAAVAWMQSLVNYAVPEPDISADAGVMFPSDADDAAVSNDVLGHVAVITGYAPAPAAFIVRNSFGFQWGNQGRFTLRAADVTSRLVQQAIAVQSVRV